MTGLLKTRIRRARELAGDELDGGERGAELVRGGGGEAADGGQALLAAQRLLGGAQRLGLGVADSLVGRTMRHGTAGASGVAVRVLGVRAEPRQLHALRRGLAERRLVEGL